MLFDGDTFEYMGHTFKAQIKHDEDMGPPWEEGDGYGVVSEWTSRDKRPGERVLCSDRGSKRYYDWQESIKIARRDGWDAEPYRTGTKGEQAVRAVQRDFEYLRAWCNDKWYWVGLVITLLDADGEETFYEDSCWGYESNYVQDSMQAAHEHAGNILYQLKRDEEQAAIDKERRTFPVAGVGI